MEDKASKYSKVIDLKLEEPQKLDVPPKKSVVLS